MMPGDYPMSSGGLLADWQIREYAEQGMIEPFTPSLVKEGISRGMSSFGYDIRLGHEFVSWHPYSMAVIDPHCVDEIDVHRFTADQVVLEPGEFLLGVTVETLTLPRNVTAIVCDKSSLARCGIALQNTVIEAGFSGTVTLEITNHNCRPVVLRSGEGIAQVLFLTGPACEVSYAARKGKYQGQVGVTLPRRGQ